MGSRHRSFDFPSVYFSPWHPQYIMRHLVVAIFIKSKFTCIILYRKNAIGRRKYRYLLPVGSLCLQCIVFKCDHGKHTRSLIISTNILLKCFWIQHPKKVPAFGEK